MPHRARISRLATRIAIVAALGIAVTVLIAWCCAMRPWPSFRTEKRFAFRAGDRWFVYHEFHDWWMTMTHVQRAEHAAIRVNRVGILTSGELSEEVLTIGPRPWDARLPEAGNTADDRQLGWPFRALWAGEDSDWFADSGQVLGYPRTLEVPPVLGQFCRVETGKAILPYGVLPRGLVLDGLLYGSFIWALWRGPGAIRRRARGWK